MGNPFGILEKLQKSTGVAILIKQNLNIQILTVTKDDEGRLLSLIFSFSFLIFSFSKNSKKRNFYKTLNKYITLDENIILGGDFNILTWLKIPY